MPTYRNDGTEVEWGGERHVKPGETILTSFILKSPFTKISDEPYFNVLNAIHEITGSAGASVEVSITLSSDVLEIYNVSSDYVDVFLASLSNTPGIRVPKQTVRKISGLKGKVEKVFVKLNGDVASKECYVMEVL